MKPEITICTCWDGRDYYPKEYINILYRMVERHTTVPHDWVIYVGPEAEGKTGGIDPGIRIVPTQMTSWWLVTKFWEPNPVGIETPSLLYLDLDIVILGSLDDLILFPSDHACSREYPRVHVPVGAELQAMGAKNMNANIGISLIRSNGGARVWEEYIKEGAPQWDPLVTHSRGNLPLAGQTIINNPKYGVKTDLFSDQWVCSYKYEVLKRGIPEDCRIVHFHGRPKPHEVMEKHSWIKENWR